MRRSVILDSTIRLVYDSAAVLSVYLLFAGHNQPGGGFVGGLVAGAAIALRYLSGGMEVLRRSRLVPPWIVLALGVGLASATAVAPLLWGRALLDSVVLELDVPVLGQVKATSALPFDIGVYLVVVGLVLMVFEALGDEPAQDAARAASAAEQEAAS